MGLFLVVQGTARRRRPVPRNVYLEDHDRTGYINREKVETDAGVWSSTIRYRLYVTFEASLSWQIKDKREKVARAEAVLPTLKQQMADAHPDRGGTSAAFIAARARSEAARRAAGKK